MFKDFGTFFWNECANVDYCFQKLFAFYFFFFLVVLFPRYFLVSSLKEDSAYSLQMICCHIKQLVNETVYCQLSHHFVLKKGKIQVLHKQGLEGLGGLSQNADTADAGMASDKKCWQPIFNMVILAENKSDKKR